MHSISTNPVSMVFVREIERFVAATSGTHQLLYRNRRNNRRQHRECPLLVVNLDISRSTDVAGTLCDISDEGLGFLCDAGFRGGTLIGVKLFWSDVCSPRVPAIIRHCEIHPEGFLIGAEFAVNDPNACKVIEKLAPPTWYG